MPVTSNNSIAVNKRVDLVALRAAQAANYLTIGSKAYFSDQLADKKNGTEYGFILRDAGNVANSIVMDNTKNTITEKTVKLSLEPWNIGVKANAVESVTDIHTWDVEICEPNGQKLVNGAVRKTIEKDAGKASTAWVGRGFVPLSQGIAHLNSITSEELYGFVEPQIEAIVTSMGAQFVPSQAPDLYKKGSIGVFHGADFHSQRFLKAVVIDEAIATAMQGATVASYTAGNDYDTISINLGAAAASATKMPKGSVIWIDGVMATDLVGDPTSAQYAFIVLEDVAVASGASTVDIKVDPLTLALGGTRDASAEDGAEIKAADFAGKTVTMPEAGKYFTGYIRANGAMQFQTLDKLDVSNAETSTGSYGGITIHQNKVVDLVNFENICRFDLVTLAGIVEKRANTYVMVK